MISSLRTVQYVSRKAKLGYDSTSELQDPVFAPVIKYPPNFDPPDSHMILFAPASKIQLILFATMPKCTISLVLQSLQTDKGNKNNNKRYIAFASPIIRS
jgi:hypothetical protein